MGNHVKEQNEDEIKRAVGLIVEKIKLHEAPEELIRLYETMKVENFAFWLHGYFYGYSKKLKFYSFDAYRFLEEIWQTI